MVLHGAIFLVTCLATSEKKIIASCRSHVKTCNLELKFAVVSKQSMQSLQKLETEFYFVQSLQPHKCCEASGKEGMLHKLQRKLHRVTLALLFATIA